MAENNSKNQLRQILRYVRIGVISILGLILLFGSFVQIETEEVGVVTQFGKYSRTLEPGLHFKIPIIESVARVAVERQQKQEFGFRTVRAGVESEYSKNGYDDESLMLTGDLNLADVEWVVQYRVKDPYNYLFKVRNPETTLRDVSEAAMRQIVGDRTVNEVITIGRAEIASEAQVLLQKLCDEYSLGLEIDQVVLQDVNPPDPVKAAFNAVNEAQQEKETLINQARSDYNRVIPRARGQAEETINKADGYATARVNNAEGEAARFIALYNEYVRAPEVTKKRIYLETMQRILPKLGNRIITDESGNNILPLLQMQLEQASNPQ
ncbi:MAG: FtsH protease activity modulator HflK [Flavobacteriia bacterium]|nr:FtsH protease activity modulator HflK [Flavobacteriia bacterium]